MAGVLVNSPRQLEEWAQNVILAFIRGDFTHDFSDLHLAPLRSAVKCNPTESHAILFKIVKSPLPTRTIDAVKHGAIYSVWRQGIPDFGRWTDNNLFGSSGPFYLL